jgi:hypothetical protein
MRKGVSGLHLVPLMASLVTLIIAPGIVYDPINLPKFVVLMTSAALLLPVLLVNARRVFEINWVLTLLALSFCIFLVIAFFTNEGFLAEQLWGIWGRSTGLLTYISLVVFLMTVFLMSTQSPNESLRVGLERTSYVVSGYTLIQYAGLDPINWSQKLPFATLGNINFMSSFLGLASISMLARIILEKSPFLRSIHFASFVLLNIILIYGSGSIQGLAVFLTGCVLLLSFKVRVICKGAKAPFLFLASSIITGALLMLGTVGIGPLASIQQETVLYRLDYWRTGVRMTLENLINGVGIDLYGFYYKQYRDIEAVTRTGPERVSNTAHNVIVDISSGAGIIAGVCVSLFFLLAFYQIFLLLRDRYNNSTDITFIAIAVAYFVFCLISINQIGVAVWGFAALGHLFGIRVRIQSLYGTETGKKQSQSKKRNPNNIDSQIRSSSRWVWVTSLVVGLAISLYPFTLERRMLNAEREQDLSAMKKVAENDLSQTFYREKLLLALVEKGETDVALTVARDELDRNSRSEIALRVIAFSDLASPKEKLRAKSMLLRLDPLNRSLPSELGMRSSD